MKTAILIGALLFALQNGCDDPHTTQAAPVDNAKVDALVNKYKTPEPQGYQRFVPIHLEPANLTGVPWSGSFALDTKTGQLCRTYLAEDKFSGLSQCSDLRIAFPD